MSNLKTYIENNETAYKAADAQIATNLNSEISRATTAENTLKTSIENNISSIDTAYKAADTILQTNINTVDEKAKLANNKADAIAEFKDENGDSITTSSQTISNIKLKEAVDASNAKANNEALSQMQEDQDKLQKEQEKGNIFIEFFNKLFSSK